MTLSQFITHLILHGWRPIQGKVHVGIYHDDSREYVLVRVRRSTDNTLSISSRPVGSVVRDHGSPRDDPFEWEQFEAWMLVLIWEVLGL